MSTNDQEFAAVRVWLDGELNAEAVDPHDPRAVLLASYLQSDVQASEEGARYILEWLDAVLSGESESDGGSGNAHRIIIDREGVLIENEYLEELNSFRYTHDELRAALEQTLTAMLEHKAKRRSSSDPE